MSSRTTSLLAGALGLGFLPGLAAAAVPAPTAEWRAHAGAVLDDRRSLQELLLEARAERERVQAELLPRVTTAIAILDELERRVRDERAGKIVGELVGLGSDVAPLLVQYLDPGETASRALLFR